MNTTHQGSRNLLIASLCGVAVALLAVIPFSPVWWVSLKAPNYPEVEFPAGVRIHVHLSGVFNGCKTREGRQIQDEAPPDCLHEMDTINHYFGMYPIAAGAPVERAFSPFLIALLGVMVIGYAVPKRHPRVAVLAAGSVVIAAWMFLTFHTEGGVKYQNAGYLEALVVTLDREVGDVGDDSEQLSASQAIVERLRGASKANGVESEPPGPSPATPAAGKQGHIDNLRIAFEKDRERRDAPAAWEGSNAQLLVWHYAKTLGRYFNNPEDITPRVNTLKTLSSVAFWSLIAAMVVVVAGAWLWRPFRWLLVLVPMALPLLFIIDYAGWLWWFGHNLNEMSAFTVKAFMPTVFGQGKVGQFSIYSYPDYGFAMMLLLSLVLGAAAVLRRRRPAESGHGRPICARRAAKNRRLPTAPEV